MDLRLLTCLLLLPLAICLAVAVYVWPHRQQLGVRLLIATMLASSLFTAAYAGELLSPQLATKLVWLNLYYLGGLAIGPFVLLLAFWYVHATTWLSPQRMLFVFVPATLLLALVLTNNYHHLFYLSHNLDLSGPLPVRISERGPVYWIAIAAMNVYLLAASFLFWRAWRISSYPYNIQAALLMVAALAPVAGLLLHILGANPFGYVNLSSFSLAVTGLAMAWGISRHRMFDLTPIAQRIVIEHLSSGLLVVDNRSQLVEINPAACSMLAIARDTVIGLPFAGVLAAWPELAAIMQAAHPAEREIHLQYGDTGLDLLVNIQALPPYPQPTDGTGFVTLLMDLTALRNTERAHIQQQRRLATLEEREKLARDLHDGIGQVLGFLSTQAQVAHEYLTSGQLHMADAALEHLTTIAQDANAELRNFILGAQPGKPLPLTFAEALHKYVDRFETTSKLAVQIEITDDCEEQWLTPNAQTQLLHVVQESLTNAHKHAAADQVQVRCRLSADAVTITIADLGTGFDMATQEQPREHFGLGIMQARMQELGGDLEIRSAVNRGTEVIAHLCRYTLPAQHDDVLAAIRVVIADDQPLFRDGLHNLLAARGVQVIGVAGNGAEAVELVRELTPDVVILDIQMPVMDGLEATRQIKQVCPNVSVLILTVAETDATLAEALRLGASGYLLKTLDGQTLFTMLEQLARGEAAFTPSMTTRLTKLVARTQHCADAYGLTDRHLEILHLMAKGDSYPQIAEKIHLSESAVKYNARQIITQLHARTRAEAVRIAVRNGLT